MLALHVDEELQAVVLLREVLEQYLLGFAVGLLHVVDEELLEVARDNPARMLAHGQAHHVAPCLLEGVQQRAVALQDALAQVFAQRLLLDEHARRRYAGIDEVGGVHHAVVFEADEAIGGGRDAKHVLEQVEPERLRLAPFVAAAPPAFGKC